MSFPSDHSYLKHVFLTALCQKPEIRNGMLSANKDEYVESEHVTVQCHSGFALLGSPNITCLENGTWYPEMPKCEQVSDTNQEVLCHQTLKRFSQPATLTYDLLCIIPKSFREPVFFPRRLLISCHTTFSYFCLRM